jgi:hypothetical protein
MIKNLKHKKVIIILLFVAFAVTSILLVREYMTRDVFVSEFGYSFQTIPGYVIKDHFLKTSDSGTGWQMTNVYLSDEESMPFIVVGGPITNISNEQLEKIRQGRGYYKSGQDASSYVYLDDWKFPPALIETSEGLFALDLLSQNESRYGYVRNAPFNEDYLALMRLVIATLDVKKGVQEEVIKKVDGRLINWGWVQEFHIYDYNSGLDIPEVRGDIYADELRGAEL